MTAPLPPPLREAERLSALYRYEILDTPPEKELDDLVHLAAYICHTPISLISLVDSDRQWFKSKVGLTVTETSRYIAFCAHAILEEDLLVVPDALADERFARNPLVTGDPHIRFYCGAPLVTPDGYRIGTLNVIDYISRELSEEQLEALRVLSRQVMEHLTLDRKHRELVQAVNGRLEAEQALRVSESKFRILSDTALSGIYMFTRERLVYANPAGAAITGYNVDELLDLSFGSLIHPSFQERWNEHTQALREGRDVPTHIELQIVRKDGAIRWLEFSGALIEIDGKQARIATVYDITKHKQAEELVRVQQRFSEYLLRDRPWADTMEFLSQSIEALSHGGICSILLMDQKTKTLHRGAGSGLPEAYNEMVEGLVVGPGMGTCGTAAYRKTMVVTEDIANETLWAPWPRAKDLVLEHGLKACTSMPILDGPGDVLGTFAIYFKENRRPTDFELKLLQAGADTLRMAFDRMQSEAARRDSEQRLFLFIEQAPTAIAMLDRDMCYVASSSQWRVDYGLGDQPIEGRSHYDLFPDLPEHWKEIHRRCLAGTMARNDCEAWPRADGMSEWLRWEIRPWHTYGNEIGGLIIFSEIITKRIQSEQAVRVSELRLQAILDNSLLMIFLKDREGRYLITNQVFERLFNFSRGHAIGKTDEELFPPDQAAAFRRNDNTVLQTGVAMEFEEVARYDDGEHTSIVVKFPLLDHQAAVYAIGGMVTDITRRRQAVAALERSEERFRLVSLATRDILWDWHIGTNQAWGNSHGRELFGPESSASLKTGEWGNRLHPDDRTRVLTGLNQALSDLSESWSCEYRFLLADKSYAYVMDRGCIVRDAEGNPLRMVGAMLDISARKKAFASLTASYAKLQEMSRAVQTAEEKERRRLSRELHDEFGQLLSAVKFDLNNLKTDLFKLRSPRALALRKRSESAMSTVDRLFVSFREVLAALRPATLEIMGLVPALRTTVETLQRRTGLICRFAADQKNVGVLCGPAIEGAVYRMAQELLMNVEKHAKAKAVTVTLTCDESSVGLKVQDDGVGFYSDRLPQGARFGLRGIQERAELFGGSLSIRSAQGTGTTVTIRLPYGSPSISEGPVDSSLNTRPPKVRKRVRHEKTR